MLHRLCSKSAIHHDTRLFTAGKKEEEERQQSFRNCSAIGAEIQMPQGNFSPESLSPKGQHLLKSERMFLVFDVFFDRVAFVPLAKAEGNEEPYRDAENQQQGDADDGGDQIELVSFEKKKHVRAYFTTIGKSVCLSVWQPCGSAGDRQDSGLGTMKCFCFF